jgi:hypothetical protein
MKYALPVVSSLGDVVGNLGSNDPCYSWYDFFLELFFTLLYWREMNMILSYCFLQAHKC